MELLANPLSAMKPALKWLVIASKGRVEETCLSRLKPLLQEVTHPKKLKALRFSASRYGSSRESEIKQRGWTTPVLACWLGLEVDFVASLADLRDAVSWRRMEGSCRISPRTRSG